MQRRTLSATSQGLAKESEGEIMYIKKGKEEAFKKFLQENNDTMEKRMRSRFLFQWMAMIEMGMDGGGDFNDVTKRAYDDLKDQFGGMPFDIPSHLNFLADVWTYGLQLKEWYDRHGHAGKARGKAIRSEVCITKHAKNRMHTRCGLNRKAQHRAASRAFKNGLSFKESEGDVRNYMVGILDHTEDREHVELRLYGDKIYIFKTMDNCNLLITVMQVPNKYVRMMNTGRNLAIA